MSDYLFTFYMHSPDYVVRTECLSQYKQFSFKQTVGFVTLQKCAICDFVVASNCALF